MTRRRLLEIYITTNSVKLKEALEPVLEAMEYGLTPTPTTVISSPDGRLAITIKD